MIDKIITAYLRNNKRLVVPDFGAFILKDGEEVVFVEFLKKDDRVLSSLLCKEFTIDEDDARSAIDEYVMKIRRTVGATGKYVIEGLGSLHTDVNGLFALAYDPRVRKETPDIEIPAPEPPAPAPERPAMQVYTKEDHVRERKPELREEAAPRGEVPEGGGSHKNPNVIEFGFPEQKTDEQPKPVEKKPFTLNDLYSIPASEDIRDERHKPAQRPAQGVRDDRSAHSQRPAQHRQAQSPADRDRLHRPDPERRPRRADEWEEDEAPRRRPVVQRKKKKGIVDWIVIIAIVIALFALGSIIYGLLTSGEITIKQTNPSIENVVDQDAPDAQNGSVEDSETGQGA